MHDFQDRRYMPVQGRWLSPDPAGLAAVDPSSPQSWNRYAYVNNNPLALVDPFGDDSIYSCDAVPSQPQCQIPYQWTAAYGGLPPALPNGYIIPGVSQPVQPLYAPKNPDDPLSGEYLLTPCGPPPIGIKNQPNCTGYQPGQETAQLPTWYQDMVYKTYCMDSTCSNISESLYSKLTAEIANVDVSLGPLLIEVDLYLYFDWAAFFKGMDDPLATAFPSFPQPPPMANFVQNCIQSAKALAMFMKMHPGVPPPFNMSQICSVQQ
jgi:RHS repeat-associated protein